MLNILVLMVPYMYIKTFLCLTALICEIAILTQAIESPFIFAIGDSSSPWLKSFVFQIVCTVLLIRRVSN